MVPISTTILLLLQTKFEKFWSITSWFKHWQLQLYQGFGEGCAKAYFKHFKQNYYFLTNPAHERSEHHEGTVNPCEGQFTLLSMMIIHQVRSEDSNPSTGFTMRAR